MAKDTQNIESGKDPRVRLYAISVYFIYQECFKNAGIIEGERFDENSWAGRLVKKLAAAFPDNIMVAAGHYDTYLRDRFRNACNAINQKQPFSMTGFSWPNFEPLVTFAGAGSPDEINDGFKKYPGSAEFHIDAVAGSYVRPEQISNFLLPVTDGPPPLPAENGSRQSAEAIKHIVVPFIYTSTAYGAFRFNKIPEDEGYIYFYGNGDIQCQGRDEIFIKKGDLRRAETFRMPGDPETWWVRIEYISQDRLHEGFFAQPGPLPKKLALLPAEHLLPNFSVRVAG